MKTHHFTGAALAALVTVSAFGSTRFVSNDVKYRDSSLPHATGRSGNASIEAFALLGKDGATDLEITAAGGTLDRVQIKLPSGTENVNGLSGTSFTHRLTGVLRQSSVGVQANVDDGIRTGVVSVDETVKLRPDLLVHSIDALPHTAVGMPYSIRAVVREANGDLGARASCVLYAGGAEVDRAENVWVDAGGTVTCEMSHIFTSGGRAQLSVAVIGTSPGDYDVANNTSAAVDVRVYDSVTELTPWSASASHETFERRNYYRSQWGANDSSSSGWMTGFSFFSIYRDRDINVETLKASVHAETDGRTIHEMNDVAFVRSFRIDPWTDGEITCALGALDDDYGMFSACRITSWMFDPYVTVGYNWNAGDATYISRGWYQTYVGGQITDVHYNNVTREQHGTPFEMGNTASMRLRFSDGTNYWDVNPSMTLQPFSYRYEQPEYCYSDGFCFGSLDARSGKLGSDSSANQ